MAQNLPSKPDDSARLADYKQRFFVPELELSDSTKEVLVKYSKIPTDQLQAHVEGIVRDW